MPAVCIVFLRSLFQSTVPLAPPPIPAPKEFVQGHPPLIYPLGDLCSAKCGGAEAPAEAPTLPSLPLGLYSWNVGILAFTEKSFKSVSIHIWGLCTFTEFQ